MSSNKLVTCPYDEVHKVKESRLALHITKCRLNHLNEEKFTCPFNASHILPMQEKKYHLSLCADRAPLERMLAEDVLYGKNKGRTDVPSYTASAPVVTSEIWDDEEETTPTTQPSEVAPPAWAIIEPRPLSKPAERRRLYQELHRMPTEIEKHSNPTDIAAPKNTVINQARQPKAPSQVQIKSHSVQNSLGLGRGKPVAAPPTSRIAANIFPSQQQTSASSAGNYSAALTTGMSNLGFGRGSNVNSANTLNDDEEFPALGCGRGIFRPAKNVGVRQPGSRS